MKKAIVYWLLVISLVYMTACSTQSEQSSTAEPQPSVSDITETTTAPAKRRATDVAAIVKNDLEIDGIHISLPCTSDEFLATLGVHYSFESFGGLLYDGERTPLWIVNEYGSDQIRTIGYQYRNKADFTSSYYAKGILTINSIDGNQPYSFEQITDGFCRLPNVVTRFGDKNQNIRIQYYSGTNLDTASYVIQCSFIDSKSSILVSEHGEGEENNTGLTTSSLQ